jgi:hypothetical protein
MAVKKTAVSEIEEVIAKHFPDCTSVNIWCRGGSVSVEARIDSDSDCSRPQTACGAESVRTIR